MPELKNDRHEHVAQLLATRQAPSRTAAYRIAYQISNDVPSQGLTSRGSAVARRPEVQKRIQEIRAGLDDEVLLKTALDRSWVIEQGLRVYNECMREGPIFNAKGDEVDRKPRDLSVASRMLALIGKETGTYETKKTRTLEPEAISDEALLKKAMEYGLIDSKEEKKLSAKSQSSRKAASEGADSAGASAVEEEAPDLQAVH